MSVCAYIRYGHSRCNRPVSQIPQCICAISHKARFCNINVNMCTTVSVYVHCGIFSDAFWDLWNVSIVVAAVNNTWVCRKNNNQYYWVLIYLWEQYLKDEKGLRDKRAGCHPRQSLDIEWRAGHLSNSKLIFRWILRGSMRWIFYSKKTLKCLWSPSGQTHKKHRMCCTKWTASPRYTSILTGRTARSDIPTPICRQLVGHLGNPRENSGHGFDFR